MKDKNPIIISTAAEKHLKNSTPCHDKNSQKSGIEGMYLKNIEALYEKPTVNIILNGKKLKAFPLRSETRQGFPLSALLFSIGSSIQSN